MYANCRGISVERKNMEKYIDLEQALKDASLAIITNKITTQKVASKGNFSVDLTGNPVTFHIGKTNINYSVEKSKNRDMVTFEIFVDDGFWDPNFLRQSDHSKKEQRHPDGPGPNLEMGGIPYRYGVRTRSYFFKPVTP